MAAFKRGFGALVLLGFIASAAAYGQAERGQRGQRDQLRGERKAQQAPPKQRSRDDRGQERRRTNQAPQRGRVEREHPQAPPMPDAKFMLIGVEHADAWEAMNAVNMMSRVCGLRVACQVIGGRALIVGSDNDQALERISRLVKELDQPSLAEAPSKADVCLAVPLEQAYAIYVADYLHDLMPARKSRPRIVADKPANTLWIAGGETEVRHLADLAREIDANAARVGKVEKQYGRELRFHKVVHADAERVAKLMSHLASRADLDAEIIGDSASQSLVAYASPAEHEQLDRILEQLDTLPEHPRKRPPASRGERGPRRETAP
jgi:type II secretory pathway component GspD/PulD (secretin)